MPKGIPGSGSKEAKPVIAILLTAEQKKTVENAAARFGLSADLGRVPTGRFGEAALALAVAMVNSGNIDALTAAYKAGVQTAKPTTATTAKVA
jgi:ABC-type thiamine transport system ATPase subunit